MVAQLVEAQTALATAISDLAAAMGAKENEKTVCTYLLKQLNALHQLRLPSPSLQPTPKSLLARERTCLNSLARDLRKQIQISSSSSSATFPPARGTGYIGHGRVGSLHYPAAGGDRSSLGETFILPVRKYRGMNSSPSSEQRINHPMRSTYYELAGGP